MFLLSDVITYVRRLIKSASNAVVSDALILDYINRFYVYDVPARLQLFELKTTYQFVTQPLVDQYNIPYYPAYATPGPMTVSPYPMYQMLEGPVLVDGVEIPLYTDPSSLVKVYPAFFQNEENDVAANGGSTYSFMTANNPLLRANIDVNGQIAVANGQPIPFPSLNSAVFITGIDASNNIVTLQDVGPNYPPARATGDANVGNLMLTSDLQAGNLTVNGTINYSTGQVTNANFVVAIPSGNEIQVKYCTLTTGFIRLAMFYNNTITLRPVPDDVYLMSFSAYLTPVAFLNTAAAMSFGYMSEYLARGAARKMLSDTGDWDQFDRYEPLFREQENNVLRRTERQNSVSRTPTIFTELTNQYGYWNQPGNGT